MTSAQHRASAAQLRAAGNADQASQHDMLAMMIEQRQGGAESPPLVPIEIGVKR